MAFLQSRQVVGINSFDRFANCFGQIARLGVGQWAKQRAMRSGKICRDNRFSVHSSFLSVGSRNLPTAAKAGRESIAPGGGRA